MLNRVIMPSVNGPRGFHVSLNLHQNKWERGEQSYYHTLVLVFPGVL